MTELHGQFRVGPERRSDAIDDVDATEEADLEEVAGTLNAVIAVLRKAGFIPESEPPDEEE